MRTVSFQITNAQYAALTAEADTHGEKISVAVRRLLEPTIGTTWTRDQEKDSSTVADRRLARGLPPVSYQTARSRIRKARGYAREHSCVTCGGPARTWAYLGGCPNELRDERSQTYSLDIERYQPMCARCHRVMDETMKKLL